MDGTADTSNRGQLPAILPPESTNRFGSRSTASESTDRDASFGFGTRSRAAAADLIGCTVGGVRITGMIADGGMGRVYEGVQESPCRRVAVKVLRPDLVSAERLRRFAFEAEILGRLKHPGIAQIHTAGTHVFGGVERPYFVMEYVDEARPITAFARQRCLGPRECLLLFKDVCEAIGHGHTRGVIHRDLKPANLLVDGSGHPKVIDFGVARATGAEMARAGEATAHGDLVGTAAYMSPEQFAANPDDIDVRSDVYSLGLVLYELLAGRQPFDLQRLPVYEIARVVREAIPPPLERACPAAGRDVSCIVAKCLEKEPARRYGSAGELVDDIRRHLAGEPILAVPATLLDTARRFVSRHRAVTAAAAVAAASVAAALVGISLLAVEASRQAREARRGQERADAVLAFLVDALTSPDPARDGRKVTVAETLTRAAESLRQPDHAGIADPATRGSILSAVGTTLRNLGLPREAAEALEEGLEAAGGVDAAPDVVAALAGSLQGAGELERSVTLYGDLLAVARGRHEPRLTARALQGLASVESQLGRYDEARAHVTEALDILDGTGLSSTRELANGYGLLGAIASYQARYQEAVDLNERALRISEDALGLRDTTTLTILVRLGSSLDKLGELERAQTLFERGMPVARDYLGDDHPITCNLLEAYGLTLISRGLDREAEEPLTTALRALERSLGPDHISIATVSEKIAWSLLRRGRFQEAEQLLRRGLNIKETVLGPRHAATAQSLALLGWAVSSQQRAEEARPIIERCLSIRREVLGNDNQETARSLFAMAENCTSRGDPAAAVPFAEESIAIMERIHGADCQHVIPALNALGRARESLKEYDEAVALAARALAIRERHSDEKTLDTAAASFSLAERLRVAGRDDEAQPYYARCLAIREQLLDPGSPLLAEVRKRLKPKVDPGSGD